MPVNFNSFTFKSLTITINSIISIIAFAFTSYILPTTYVYYAIMKVEKVSLHRVMP